MDARGDLDKYLIEHIRAIRLPRGTNHNRWGIGNDMLEVPDNITGSRTFLNYKSEARRKAIAQGLLPPRPKPLPEGLFETERRKQRKCLKQAKRDRPSVEEGTAEDVALWQKQRLLEELANKRRFIEEARVGGSMRTCVSFGERVDKMTAAIENAGKPLDYEEICRAVGWFKAYDKEAARRVLNKAVPGHFRVVPTERKRYPKFDLAKNAPQPAGQTMRQEIADEVGAEVATARTTAIPGSATAALTATVDAAAEVAAKLTTDAEAADCRWIVGEIRKMVEEFRGSDPQRACFVLGEVAGLIHGSANRPKSSSTS